MLDAILWGLIQGLTEFLPISSSGHVVLIPALLGRSGPDLATNAMLHLGTLVAAPLYFRSDIVAMVKFDRAARKLITLLVIGTIPAVALGFTFEDRIEVLALDPRVVAGFLIVGGIILLLTTLLRVGDGRTEDLGPRDSLVIGLSQALALIPGISRSGMTIAAGLARGMSRTEAARFAFLLGIPVTAGAGLLKLGGVWAQGAAIPVSVWVGMVVAGTSGYIAIAVLLRLLRRVGLAPFGIYSVTFGVIALLML